jgi:hypothetical protein
VKAMVGGHPSGAQCGHQTMAGCIAEWQEHCVLGVHPHPADPVLADNPRSLSPAPATATATPISTVGATPGPSCSQAYHADPGFQAELCVQVRQVYRTARLTHPSPQFCMPNLAHLSLGTESGAATDDRSLSARSSGSVSSLSSVTATTWAEVPAIVRYFALWGGRSFTQTGEASQMGVSSLSDTVQRLGQTCIPRC